MLGGDGSWPMIEACTFRGNGTGFLFDSSRATSTRLEYPGNVFEDNETAVLLERVPGSGGELQFDGCVFSGNGEDIVNESGYTVSP